MTATVHDRAGAAPRWSAIRTQAAVELRLTARRGENLLAMVGIPVALLLLLGSTDVLPLGASGEVRLATLLPGILAISIVATGLVNLGIATAYERSYGVLQRLGGSPLGASGLIVAKILTVLFIELVLAGLLVGVAVLLGWRPVIGPSLVLLVPAVALGTATFTGLGLALAGALRAEAVLLVANVLFLVVIAVGGVVVPPAVLPEGLVAGAALLPSSALRDALAGALGSTSVAFEPWLVLGAWAGAAVALATRLFRWD